MKKYFLLHLMLSMFVVLWIAFGNIAAYSANANESRLTIYPAPSNEILSKDYMLEVNGRKVDIYLAKIAVVENRPSWTLDPQDVGGPYSFSYFDFQAKSKSK
jgi:hypothetical protein